MNDLAFEVKQQPGSLPVLYTFVSTITGHYRQFGDIGASALELLATRRQVMLTEEDRARILQGMQHLPAHADVVEGLEMRLLKS